MFSINSILAFCYVLWTVDRGQDCSNFLSSEIVCNMLFFFQKKEIVCNIGSTNKISIYFFLSNTSLKPVTNYTQVQI